MSAGIYPMQASWSPAAIGGDPISASVRHMIDLSAFLPAPGPSWPEALSAETRRHFEHCFGAIEGDLRARLTLTPLAAAVAMLESPLVWPAVQGKPMLLGPALVAHMRLRAAVSLIARQAARDGGDPAAPADAHNGWLVDDADPRVPGAAALLANSESGWANGPMAADLPAEHYAELVWTAAALLGHRLRPLADGAAEGMEAVGVAAAALLAGHREEEGGFARAAILARLLRGREQRQWMLGQAIGERRLLLFAALAAEANGIDTETALHLLIDGPLDQLVALCRASQAGAGDLSRLLLDLRVARSDLDDMAIARLAQDYDDIAPAQAVAAIRPLRQPAPLRARLAFLTGAE